MDYQKAVIEILDSAQKLTSDRAQVRELFQASGIKVDGNLIFIGFNGNPDTCVKTLMEKLSAMPVIKISAKRILRNEGIST